MKMLLSLKMQTEINLLDGVTSTTATQLNHTGWGY